MINTTLVNKRNAARKAMDDLQTIGELIEYSCLEYDNGAMFEFADDKVQRQGEGEAIAKISRIQFLIECKVAASYFAGLTDDDAVAIIAGNSYEWILAFAGITGCGKTAVAIDQNSNVEDIAYMLDLADCRTVLCASNAMDRVQRAANLLQDASGVQVHCLEELRGRVHLHSASSAACWNSSHDADKLAAIYFTSGTTGKQKGVPLTHRNIVVSAVGNAKTFRSEGSEKAIACLPFHHCYGLFNGVLSALACGASIYINSRLIRLAGEIRDRQVTTAIVVPAMLEMIMKISRADKD
ncbi:MAG: acyl--CoA ligase, partial [Mogibacterium sp.]|nr:acyl--CoA ligase [Mogibacterium sp.]